MNSIQVNPVISATQKDQANLRIAQELRELKQLAVVDLAACITLTLLLYSAFA